MPRSRQAARALAQALPGRSSGHVPQTYGARTNWPTCSRSATVRQLRSSACACPARCRLALVRKADGAMTKTLDVSIVLGTPPSRKHPIRLAQLNELGDCTPRRRDPNRQDRNRRPGRRARCRPDRTGPGRAAVLRRAAADTRSGATHDRLDAAPGRRAGRARGGQHAQTPTERPTRRTFIRTTTPPGRDSPSRSSRRENWIATRRAGVAAQPSWGCSSPRASGRGGCFRDGAVERRPTMTLASPRAFACGIDPIAAEKALGEMDAGGQNAVRWGFCLSDACMRFVRRHAVT